MEIYPTFKIIIGFALNQSFHRRLTNSLLFTDAGSLLVAHKSSCKKQQQQIDKPRYIDVRRWFGAGKEAFERIRREREKGWQKEKRTCRHFKNIHQVKICQILEIKNRTNLEFSQENVQGKSTFYETRKNYFSWQCHFEMSFVLSTLYFNPCNI